MMLLVVLAAPVAHELESTEDLTRREETDEFCTDDADTDQLSCVEAANAAEDVASGSRRYRLPR